VLSSCSLSNTLALPVNTSPSLPEILATAPPGAILPRKIWRCPLFLMGFERGRIIAWFGGKEGQEEMFSAIVLPVTVGIDPFMSPAAIRNLINDGVPPICQRSSIKYFPVGAIFARKGILLLTRWKSSSVKSTSAVLAMARRCRTAFVEPLRRS